MPAPEVPVRCFICGELAEPFDEHVDPIGALVGEHQLRFWAHHERVRRVASPAFHIPSQEELDAEGRELEELWRGEIDEADGELDSGSSA